MGFVKTLLVSCQVSFSLVLLRGEHLKETELFQRIATSLHSVPAISTHEHLMPFQSIKPIEQFQLYKVRAADKPVEGALRRIWQATTFTWTHGLAPWPEDGSFDTWWMRAKKDFINARATSFYRVMLPAFKDLYGVDFDSITDDQARELNQQLSDNYEDEEWLYHVINQRANIELMIIDPSWAPLSFETGYSFAAPTCNVGSLVRGFHPSEFDEPLDSPYTLAKKFGLEINSLDDYLIVLDRILSEAKRAGAVSLKSTLAYRRTLRFEKVPKKRVAAAFGRPRKELAENVIRDFEDFIMWHLVELSAKHDLPFQIHTGYGRIQGSNPMLLVNLIESNPKTKFVLFHGGFPWVSETGLIVMTHRNVWVDSCWLPTANYTMAKRAFKEWLDMVPSNKILWGADMATAEGIYGAAEFTRQCLAEVLTEKVYFAELREEDAHRIGRQIMRENALQLFPRLSEMLWRK